MILSQPSGDSEEEISVNIKGITLSNTNWTIQGLNLFINDSNLVTVQFFIRLKPTCQICRREIKIVSSTFGHMNVRGGYDIQVSHCIVDDITVTSNSTLLDVVAGGLIVSNSSFQHLSGVEGPGLLRAVGSRIHMVGVSCSNNEAPYGLIQIQNGSELFVQNSTFMNNGHVSSPSSVISVQSNSSLSISDSVFSGNTASNGSCLRFHHNVSVAINQSTFENSTAVNGGIIYAFHAYEIILTQSDFSGEGERQLSLYIHNSYFVKNNAETGGVVYFYGDFIRFFVKKCNFTKNEADDGGAIYMKSLTGTLVLRQCLFTNNSASTRGNSLSLYGTHSQLTDCEFYGDMSSFCSNDKCINVDFQCSTSFINNCTFSEKVDTSIKASSTKLNITNSRWYGPKTYCLKFDNSDITIVGSHFAADAGEVLYDDKCSNLTVINTSFVNCYHVFNTDMGFTELSLSTLYSTLQVPWYSMVKRCSKTVP